MKFLLLSLLSLAAVVVVVADAVIPVFTLNILSCCRYFNCSNNVLELFKFQEEAVKMLSLVTHWARIDDTELGRPKLSGQEEANPIAVPMMLLYVIDEVCRDDEALHQTYSEDEEWAVQQLLKHLQVNKAHILH